MTPNECTIWTILEDAVIALPFACLGTLARQLLPPFNRHDLKLRVLFLEAIFLESFVLLSVTLFRCLRVTHDSANASNGQR